MTKNIILLINMKLIVEKVAFSNTYWNNYFKVVLWEEVWNNIKKRGFCLEINIVINKKKLSKNFATILARIYLR